jgi:hypothetical protein
MIESAYQDIVMDAYLGIITEEEAKNEAQIIKMVELTLANQHIA